MALSHGADPLSATPGTLQDATEAIIDFWMRMHQEWIRALAADYYRFWLEPYFYRKTGTRPPGYYFRLARIRKR